MNPFEKLKEKNPADQRLEILKSFERAGFEGQMDEEVVERLVRLERNSKFNEDSRKIEKGMVKVLRALVQEGKIEPLSPEEERNARIAALLHDIGKSGPAEATPEQQEAVVAIYALENVGHEFHNHPVEEVVRLRKPEGAEDILRHLEAAGFDLRRTMKDFWKQHAVWTYKILGKHGQGLNSQIVEIASSHHIDHGVDPAGIKKRVNADPKEVTAARAIGAMEMYVDGLEERILIALDQYEAHLMRSEREGHGENSEKNPQERHIQAISWVKNNLAEQFAGDDKMTAILDKIDELGENGTIFAEGQ